MVEKMKIGNREFDLLNHTYIMGILNVTPDSFSDGGKFDQLDTALYQAEKMLKEGADIIDIGGESTRPGFAYVPAEEEIERTIPVIEGIRKRFDTVISIDTYKAETARAAIKAGASLVNDVWGLKRDDEIANVIAQAKVACCLMHNRTNTEYVHFMQDIKADLEESMELARKAGISKDQIILDPGVGFAKSVEQNLEAIGKVGELLEFGCPVLLATSRKSVIGKTLDLEVDQRLEGTLVTTVMGVMAGCSFVRVHDVKENKRAIQMTRAILDQVKR